MSPCYSPMHAEMPQSYPGSSRDDPDQGGRVLYDSHHFTSSTACYMSKVHIQVCLINLKAEIQNPTSSRCFLVTTLVKSQGDHIVGFFMFFPM